MKKPDPDESRNPDEPIKQQVKRIMRGFWYLVKIGVLVPKLDKHGRPLRREGQIAYAVTSDPKTRAKYPEYFTNNN